MKIAVKKSPGEVARDWEAASNKAMAVAMAARVETGGQWTPCGFAWVEIRPARGPIVTYLKSRGIGGYNPYSRAYEVSVGLFGQSAYLKETYADALAEALRDLGYSAQSCSRLD